MQRSLQQHHFCLRRLSFRGCSLVSTSKPVRKQQAEDDIFAEAVARVKHEGRYRIFTNLARDCGNFPHATVHDQETQETKKVVVFCSNDYLGMGQHQSVVSAAVTAIQSFGVGAGGTRNIAGTNPNHALLEKELASLHGKEAALVFSSGYVANEAALSVIGTVMDGCVVFSDEQNHASMVTGMKLMKNATKHIFRHNDIAHLEELLSQYDFDRPKVVAIESVYSMSGTVANLPKVATLCRKHKALLFVDEVHAVGLYGRSGAGYAEHVACADRVDVVSGTLGKAFGVVGGYIAGRASVVDAVRCNGSGFVFTTSIPPSAAAAALASIRHCKQSRLERMTMHARVGYLKQQLQLAKIPVMLNPSHICPILVGDAVTCRLIATALLEEFGFYVQPINFPTVPRGWERLRVTVSPFHSERVIDQFVSALAVLWDRFDLPAAQS